ncbi:MAG: phage tail sheath family protein [Bradymonadales bacterium]|nr:phage tail sheath family protein [Bradymonadales bacterium]
MDERFDDNGTDDRSPGESQPPTERQLPGESFPTELERSGGPIRLTVRSDSGTGVSPGIYVGEPASLVDTGIEPAAVGVTAIVGHSRIGPVLEPVACSSESEANQHFGDFEDAGVLAAAIHGFFQNGGKRCYVLNLGEPSRTLRPQDLLPLRQPRDIELVCAPAKTDPQDYQVLMSHCSEMKTRLALLDGPQDLARSLTSLHPPAGGNGAMYVPWLRLHDPARRTVVAVPPCGHMAGLMAQVARERGVHKAPANEPLKGLIELDVDIDTGMQNILHPRRINCIRRMPRLPGFRPWGARTLAEQGPFDGIPAYRVYSYVVRSFETGCPWLAGALSEPETWERLVRMGEAFLTRLWQSGALAGSTPEEAFFIRCDGTLNEFGHPDSGRIVAEIGLALSGPGRFTVARVELDTTGFDA